MLNREERQRVLAFYCYISKVVQLPFQINADCWDIRPGAQSWWKKLACWVCFGVLFTQSLYKILSLLHIFGFTRDTALHQIILHMILAGVSGIFSFHYYVLCIRYPRTYANYAKITLTATATGSKHFHSSPIINDFTCNFCTTGETVAFKNETSGKRWIQVFLEHTLQDLIAKFLPYMSFLVMFAIIASYVYDPTMKFLIYAMMPESYKTWLWFLVCLTGELHHITMLIAIAIPPWQLQVISFELLNTSLQTLVSRTVKR